MSTKVVVALTNYLNAGEGDLAWLTTSVENPTNATLYKLDMPPSPDSAAAILVYAGKEPDETFTNSLLVRHPRIQITVRDPKSNVALDRAEAILRYLVTVKDQMIGGVRFQRIKPVGEPFELGPDESKRQRAVVNFEVSYYDSI